MFIHVSTYVCLIKSSWGSAGLTKHRSKHYNAQEIIFAAAPILLLPISEAKTTKINNLEIGRIFLSAITTSLNYT